MCGDCCFMSCFDVIELTGEIKCLAYNVCYNHIVYNEYVVLLIVAITRF